MNLSREAETNRAYDLTVAYRIYARNSKSTPIFEYDKLKLSELCLKSFRDSMGSLNIKLYVLLDNCPPEYEALFRRYFAQSDLELIRVASGGNRSTFSHQLELLLDQRHAELVYFAEDDYFYLPDQFPAMVRFMKSHGEAHFVTPYDHLDYYKSPLHRYSMRAIEYESREWRTVASTCLTFLTTRTVLRQTRAAFQSYGRSRANTDFGVWFSLTKIRVRNPLTFLRGFTDDRLWFAVMVLTWYYGWRQVLFGKRWTLWAPAPTIAAHMDAIRLPPGHDWQSILGEAVKSLD